MLKYTKNLILLLCAALCIAALSCRKAEEKPADTHVVQISEGLLSAEKWIKLIDEEKYSESWSSASALFRTALKEKKWKEILTAARGPVGKNLSRNAASKEYVTELPGVPAGEYVIIKYRSSFEKKKNTIEVITVMLDADGKWKGAGYTIK